jgi:aspartate aminotransferase
MVMTRLVVMSSVTDGFLPRPEDVCRAITANTRVLIVNSPSNPTGMVFEKKELEKIAELCMKNDMIIISDDIYRKIIFDDLEFFSIASISPELAQRTFIIDGSSKTYAMTGWRIGYCIGDSKVIKAMERLQSQSTSNPVSFAQDGAVASLINEGTQAVVEERRKIFEKRRDLIVKKLREIPGIDIVPPNGAFYAFPSISGYMERFGNATAFSEYLIEHALVALVPGGEFGAPDHARFSFATSEENIIKGLDRIKETLKTA